MYMYIYIYIHIDIHTEFEHELQLERDASTPHCGVTLHVPCHRRYPCDMKEVVLESVSLSGHRSIKLSAWTLWLGAGFRDRGFGVQASGDGANEQRTLTLRRPHRSPCEGREER